MHNLGIPWITKTSLAGFLCATGAWGSGRIPNRDRSLEGRARRAKNTRTRRTCRDTTRQDRTQCFPCTENISVNARRVTAHFSSEQSTGCQRVTDVKTLSGSPGAALKFP